MRWKEDVKAIQARVESRKVSPLVKPWAQFHRDHWGSVGDTSSLDQPWGKAAGVFIPLQ